MGEIKFIVGLVMIALFAVAIIAYVNNFGSDNSADVLLNDQEGFDTVLTEVTGNVTEFSTNDVNSSSTTFYDSTLEPGDQVMTSGGAFKVGMGSLTNSVKTIFSTTNTYLFGGSGAFGIFLTAISGLLVYIGFRYVYKSWVGRNPD